MINSSDFLLQKQLPYIHRNHKKGDVKPFFEHHALAAPSFFSLLQLPEQISECYKVKNFALSNEEFFELQLKGSQIPLNFSYGISTVSYIPVFFLDNKLLLFFLPFFAAVCGIILCGMEVVFEGNKLLQKENFIQDFDFQWLEKFDQVAEAPSLENLKKILQMLQSKTAKEIFEERLPEIQEKFTELTFLKLSYQEKTLDFTVLANHVKKNFLEKTFEKFEKNYFTLSGSSQQIMDLINKEEENPAKQKILAELEAKQRTLASLISPLLLLELEEKLPLLQEKLENGSYNDMLEALQEGRQLLKDIQTQTEKAQLVHIISIISLSFFIASFIAVLISCPLAVPIVLAAIGFGFYLIRYLLHAGLMNTKGWEFSWKDTLPEKIQKLFLEKFQEKKALSSCESNPSIEKNPPSTLFLQKA